MCEGPGSGPGGEAGGRDMKEGREEVMWLGHVGQLAEVVKWLCLWRWYRLASRL